jgi:orotate phosphoribosyltransferase
VNAIIIALDRQETTVNSTKSAVDTVAEQYGVPVLSIVGLDDIVTHLGDRLTQEQLDSIIEYKKQYGSKK